MTPTPLVLPDDAHNRELVGRVRPPDWVNPTPAGSKPRSRISPGVPTVAGS